MRKTLAGVTLAGIILSGAAALAVAAPAAADDSAPVTASQEVASSPSTPDQPNTPTAPTSPTSDSDSSPSTAPSQDAPATPPQESAADPSPATAPQESSSSSKPAAGEESSSAAPIVSAPTPPKHDPVTICHQPGTAAQQTLTVDDSALKGHLKHGDSLGACTPLFKPYEVSVRWIIPASWPFATTPSYQPAIFPQTRGETIPCGQWSQDDVYLIDSAADEATLAGLGDTLTMGEDSTIYKSHVFTQGEECPPPAPSPANPQATIDTACGVAHIVVSNPGEEPQLTASVVVYVDGEFNQALAIASGDHQNVDLTFAEDSGDHKIEVRTGPAFGDELLAEATVGSDCKPAVVVPPTTPPTTPPAAPVEPTLAAPAAPAVLVAAPAADELAQTGSDLSGWIALAGGLLAGGVGALSLRLWQRRTTRYYRKNRA